jgi:PIN domain nuclease of toxin-antitoxin system
MRSVASAGARGFVESLVQNSVADHRPICLDSSAVIAYVTNAEPVAQLVARIIDDPIVLVVLSTVTLIEAVTRPAMQANRRRVDAIHAGLAGAPNLRIISLDQAHAIETAFVRAETGLRLPDAAIVATARLAGASGILGNDRQWRTRRLGVPYHHIDDILATP